MDFFSFLRYKLHTFFLNDIKINWAVFFVLHKSCCGQSISEIVSKLIYPEFSFNGLLGSAHLSVNPARDCSTNPSIDWSVYEVSFLRCTLRNDDDIFSDITRSEIEYLCMMIRLTLKRNVILISLDSFES